MVPGVPGPNVVVRLFNTPYHHRHLHCATTYFATLTSLIILSPIFENVNGGRREKIGRHPLTSIRSGSGCNFPASAQYFILLSFLHAHATDIRYGPIIQTRAPSKPAPSLVSLKYGAIQYYHMYEVERQNFNHTQRITRGFKTPTTSHIRCADRTKFWSWSLGGDQILCYDENDFRNDVRPPVKISSSIGAS